MGGFEPAAEFLLGMNWQNLFEPATALPDSTEYRCKGCREVVAISDREKHFRKEVRALASRNTARKRELDKERVERLRVARRLRRAS